MTQTITAITPATSTTPTTVTSITQSWFKAHERLIIVALVLAFGTFGVGKFYDVEAARKDAKYVAAAQIAADDKLNSAAQAATVAQVTQQYAALVQTLAAENASLNASLTQRNVGLSQQVTKNATLPLPDLLARWNTLAGTSVTVNGVNASVSVQDSRKTVDLLESVPVLTANLTDQTKIASNYQAELEKSDVLAADLNSQITGLNTQLTDQTKACVAQVTAVKAEGKKNSVKWFKRGFIVGFVSGLWAGHAGL